MNVDYQYDFTTSKSRSGVEKKIFIKVPKEDGSDGFTFLTLGTLNRLAFNTNTQVQPGYSFGNRQSSHYGNGVSSANGVLSFAVIETSTIEYLKNQYEETHGIKYPNEAYLMQDLPEMDIVLISADENDTSGSYSMRIITKVKINSESGAIGSDVTAMTEEVTFVAGRIGELKPRELNALTNALGGVKQ